MAHAQQQLDSTPVAPVMVDTPSMTVYENIIELHASDVALKLAMLELNSVLASSATPTVTV